MIFKNIRFNDMDDGREICEAAGSCFNPLADVSIARLTPEGKLMGGVVYNGYTGKGGSIGLHYAGFHPRWFSRDMLFVCFDYPFNQLGVKKIFGQVPASNAQAIKVNLHMGFVPEKVIKDVYPDGDMLLVAMYREQCRFLNLVPSALKEASYGR